MDSKKQLGDSQVPDLVLGVLEWLVKCFLAAT